ncbi:unnamed protein product [Rotaria sp. Silwood1]|nr:unnamed protein product [Rotaria sp. Silwood1]CAF1283424.1 unnamed protein product [Rotaria sp. Silwood1]CAF4910998.1 unnamed protein product [Rotaria sp. Silwood1]
MNQKGQPYENDTLQIPFSTTKGLVATAVALCVSKGLLNYSSLLAGELVRRIDPKKRTFGQYIQDEITNPLKIKSYIDLPKEKEYRISPLYFDSNVGNIIDERTLSELSVFTDNRYHQAEIPGVNGITNVRFVARLYASFVEDLDNRQQKRLLNDDIMKKATISNTPKNDIDLVRGYPNAFAMGL